MKRSLQKHIYILVILLNGIFAFASSNQKSAYNYSINTVNSFNKNTKEFPQLKKIIFNEEDSNDKLEFTESDLEEEESFLIHTNQNFNFFLAYFDTKICANHSLFIQNRLAPCKHINYLSTLSSRYILLCVYRI
jgi:hypothetical protein